ncbi:tetratricopeptide repeat protein [Patescibacteria group bacterium]|nr:tetratricopeptide repeat protein [Patescibacteria group bacterium]MBU2259408.1 tetratricopeptide repeat protein [Patescibacteria group bacterium]
MTRRALLFLALVTFLTYAPSLGNDFVTYDDDLLVYQNPNVLKFTPQTIAEVFTTYDPELYVPITLMSYQLERVFFGLNPFIFHLTNLLLHIGSVLLVFWIALKLVPYRSQQHAFWIALTTSALFALHPINTEAVAWIAARKDILSGFLFFLSFALYLKFSESQKRRDYILSIVTFAFALGAKVSVIFLPVVLLFADWFVGRSMDWKILKDKVPFFLLSLIFGIIALLGKQSQIAGLTLVEQILLAAKGVSFYIWKLVWPTELSIFHPQSYPIETTSPGLIVPLIVLVLLIMVALFALPKRSVIFFGIAFFLTMLIPTFATFWKNGFVYFASERYAYSALFGIFFLLSFMFVPLILRLTEKRTRMEVPVMAGGLLLGLFLAFFSVAQAGTFENGETLLRHALALLPDSAHALNNLGTTLYQNDRNDEALEMYDRALAIDPLLPQVHTNRGLILFKDGKDFEAEESFRRAIASPPIYRGLLEDELQCYFLLSQMLEDRGNGAEAMRLLRQAAEVGDQYFTPHYNLGIRYQGLSQSEKAYEEFTKAVSINSRDVDTQYRLAAVAAETGRLEEAAVALRRVVRLDPDYEKAGEHLRNLEKLLKQ